SGRIQQAGGSRWVSVATRAKTRPLTGTVQVTRRGIGFVRLDEASIERSGDIGDVRVDERDLADALDGDTVLVEVLRSGRDGAAGRIVEVIDRAHQTVVGVFNRTSPRRGEVVPRNVSFHRRISVPLPEESLNVA